MNKHIFITACIFGVLAVVAGAFGAHGLKAYLSADKLEVWHTAVQYQFYHVFALMFLAFVPAVNNRLISAAYFFFTFGIIFFSGSLYFLSTAEAMKIDYPPMLGIITPIGGLFFIIGWVTLGLAAWRSK